MTNVDHKTFPMVFRDIFIGGFTQTKELIEKEELERERELEKESAFDFV